MSSQYTRRSIMPRMPRTCPSIRFIRLTRSRTVFSSWWLLRSPSFDISLQAGQGAFNFTVFAIESLLRIAYTIPHYPIFVNTEILDGRQEMIFPRRLEMKEIFSERGSRLTKYLSEHH